MLTAPSRLPPLAALACLGGLSCSAGPVRHHSTRTPSVSLDLSLSLSPSLSASPSPSLTRYARDACAGGLSALTSTTLLFPVDTLKTRWQMGMSTPRLDQMYQAHTCT